MAGSANGGRVAGAESQEMQSVSANRKRCQSRLAFDSGFRKKYKCNSPFRLLCHIHNYNTGIALLCLFYYRCRQLLKGSVRGSRPGQRINLTISLPV